jgi:hypothetical protein
MDQEHLQRRQTFLSITLAAGGAIFFLLLLILLSGGFFLYCLLAGAALCAVCLFHYAVWGRALSQEVAGEREEELLRQRAEEEDWPSSSSNGIRR